MCPNGQGADHGREASSGEIAARTSSQNWTQEVQMRTPGPAAIGLLPGLPQNEQAKAEPAGTRSTPRPAEPGPRGSIWTFDVGSDRPPATTRLASRTHSSQMDTPGPAISFVISSVDEPQNVHARCAVALARGRHSGPPPV